MVNYFYTREKFGRRMFILLIFILSNVFNTIQWIINIFLGFPEGLTVEKSFLNLIIANIGLIAMLIVIETVSNQSYKLINGLIENGIMVEEKEGLMEQAIKLIWSKWVYALSGLIYLVAFISTVAALLSGLMDLKDVIFGSFLGFIVPSILYAEVFWIMFAPALLIFNLPRRNLNINVLSSDSAGGLSPVSSYLLRVSLMLTLLGTIAIYWIVTISETELTIGLLFLTGILALPILYFTVPTIGLNSVMKDQKQKLLRKLDERINTLSNTYINSSSTIDQELINQIEVSNLLINKVKNMDEWPFSFSGLRNLLTTFLLPIGIFLLNNLDKIQELI